MGLAKHRSRSCLRDSSCILERTSVDGKSKFEKKREWRRSLTWLAYACVFVVVFLVGSSAFRYTVGFAVTWLVIRFANAVVFSAVIMREDGMGYEGKGGKVGRKKEEGRRWKEDRGKM